MNSAFTTQLGSQAEGLWSLTFRDLFPSPDHLPNLPALMPSLMGPEAEARE